MKLEIIVRGKPVTIKDNLARSVISAYIREHVPENSRQLARALIRMGVPFDQAVSSAEHGAELPPKGGAEAAKTK